MYKVYIGPHSVITSTHVGIVTTREKKIKAQVDRLH